jgi:hypothetical protein
MSAADMSNESPVEPAASPQYRMGGNPASAIYGAIVTAGLLAAEGAGHRGVTDLVISVAGTLLVFWLAHAYTDMMGGLIAKGRSDGRPSLARALREEWPIVESGLLPLLALVIARGVGAAVSTAQTVALIVVVIEIGGWAFLAGRRMELTHWRLITFMVVSGGLGVVIIVLKSLLH